MRMFQITLRAARLSCGYTPEEVAKHCGITVKAYEKIEKDSGKVKLGILLGLLKLFGVSADLIYFGTEADCIKHNRGLKGVA